MTNINVTCKCGRTLNLKSRDNWKVRDISIVCSCGIGLILNANGASEKDFEIIGPTTRRLEVEEENSTH